MSSVIHLVGDPLPAAVTGGGRELPPPVFQEVKAIMRPRPIWFVGTAALAWITINGARMLCMEDRIGSLKPGKQADLVVISEPLGGDAQQRVCIE